MQATKIRSFTKKEIDTLTMITKAPEEIVNCGMRIINTDDNRVYTFNEAKLEWIDNGEAEQKDYLEIPQVF